MQLVKCVIKGVFHSLHPIKNVHLVTVMHFTTLRDRQTKKVKLKFYSSINNTFTHS